MGVKLISIKAVGTCSKCRTKKDEILKYEDGSIIPDEDIECIECKFNKIED